MTADATSHSDISNFVGRWASSGAAERANYQIFLTELCDVLRAPRPEPTKPDEDENAYVFEKAVTFHHGNGTSSTGGIDLYKRGYFVLEANREARRIINPNRNSPCELGARGGGGRRCAARRVGTKP